MSLHREPSRDAVPLLRPASRARLAALMGAVAFGYGALNAFWLYLATGEWFRLLPWQFVADFTSPVTLPDLFERTLNVLSHPSMIWVGGLVLGTVILVPILAAVLHRTWAALALVACVWVLGHAPAMAVALAIGCVLAGRTHLRRTAPFLAAVLGALPVGLYLYLFSSAGSSSAAVLPIQRWALKAPYLAAVLAALAGFAIVLGLARASRYRPGLVWPLLAALVALPPALFAATIGRAELEYQLIAEPLAAGDAVFAPMDLRTWIASVVGAGMAPQAIPQRAAEDLEERKTQLEDRCRRFLRRFPRSRRAPAVQWILGQCQGLQLDRPALRQGWIKSTAAHAAPVPHEEDLAPARRAELAREVIQSAAQVWGPLPRDYPRSPQAALASWRLAELDLRLVACPGAPEDANLLVRRAAQRLRDAGDGLQRVADDWHRRRQAAPREVVFAEASSAPPHEYYEQALLRVRRLRWLMERNEALSIPRAAEALGALLQVNGYGLGPEAAAQQLYDLAGRYEDTPLAMNLKLAVALTGSDPRRRAEQLLILAEQDRDADAAVEAAYELGQLLLQSPELRSMADAKDPAAYFRLVRDAEGSPWKELAAERLRLLEIASRPAGPTESQASPQR